MLIRMTTGLRLAAATAAFVFACTPATADSPARVEVTGSRLPLNDKEPTSPVQTVTREELVRSGASSLIEWLQGQPAGGGSSDVGGNASFAGGSSGASLRSMGKQSTLVLLNGRRVAPYPLADYSEVFTNLDALPFEAIDRVEILKIGGAALYGSDAVAGVINIVTRQGYEGVQARISEQKSLTSGRFQTRTASIGGGTALPGTQGGSLLVNLELYQRESVVWSDVLSHVRPEAREMSPSLGSPSTYSWPGNVIGAGPVAGCAPDMLRNGLCFYDRYARFEVVPAAQRANGLLSATLPLAGGHELFTEALLSRTQTDYLSVFQPYGRRLGSVTWGNPLNNQSQTFLYRGLPASHPLNGTGVDDAELRYRFVDAPSQTQVSTTQYRLLAGHRGALQLGPQSWAWESAGGLMGGRTTMDQQGSFSLKGFHQVIGQDDPSQTDPQFFQRGYRIGQPNDPAVVATLFPHYGYKGQVRQVFLDTRLNGELARWQARPVTAAFGADLRHERFTVDPSDGLRQGDIVGNGLSASDASRWAGALFAEISMPLAPAVEVQTAARLDKFGHGQAHLSPKLAVRWAPSPQWLLRAVTEEGFRAPNLTESAPSTKFSFDNGVPDPRRCPQASDLARDLRAQANALPAADPQRTLLLARADNVINNECGASLASIVAHNPDLKPETSRSASLGVVFTPSAHARISVDAWAIERKNEIGLSSNRDLLAAEANQLPGTVNRATLANDRTFDGTEAARYGVTAGALVSTVGRFENLLRTRNVGADIAASSRVTTSWGQLDLKLDATYQSEIRFWSPVRGGWGDNLAGRSGYPRWRMSNAATWTAGALATGLRATTTSGTPLQGDFYDTTFTAEGCANQGYSPAECRVAGYTRWDLSLDYSGWRQVKLLVQVYNVFNTRAPIAVASWLNGGGILPPTNEDAKGRMLKLGLEFRWP